MFSLEGAFFLLQVWIVCFIVCFKFPQPKFLCFTKGRKCWFMLVCWSNNQWKCPLMHFKCTWNEHHAGQICTVWIFIFFSKSINSWFHSIISVYSNITSSHQTEARGMDFRTQIVLRLAFPCAGRAGLWTDCWEGGNVTEGRSRNNCNFYFILCYFIDIRPPKTEHFRLDRIAIVFY